MDKNIIDFGEYVRSIRNMSKDELLDLITEHSNIIPSSSLHSIYLGTNTLKYFKEMEVKENLPKEILIQISTPVESTGLIRINVLDSYINDGYVIKSINTLPKSYSTGCGYNIFVNLIKQ